MSGPGTRSSCSGAARLVVAGALIALASWPCPAAGAARTHRHAPVPRHAAAPPAASRPLGVIGAPMIVTVEPRADTMLTPARPAFPRPLPPPQPGMLRSTAGLVAVRLPDGTMMLDLQGRFREFSVARIDSCGRVRFGCVHGADTLRQALESRTRPAPAAFEER